MDTSLAVPDQHDRVRKHLLRALDESTDAETRFHIRQALQLTV
jgi:hypothetical protein